MINRIKKIFNQKKQEEKLSVDEVIENLFDELKEDDILIQLGSDIVPFVDFICEDIIGSIRHEIKEECGFILSAVRIIDNTCLQENEFTISLRGKEVANGFLVPNLKGVNEELYDTFKTVIYDNLETVFTNQITERYIDTVQRKNGWLIWNVTCQLSVTDIKTILVDIINSGKSINNITYIFEQIGEQILRNGEYRDCLKKYNPHKIAKQIAKCL